MTGRAGTRKAHQLRRPPSAALAPPGPKQCHPSVGTHRPPEGCLPRAVLEAAAQKLGVSGGGTSASSLRRSLETRLNVAPDHEATFLQALPLPAAERTTLAKRYLRPPMPRSWRDDPDMWLDSNNIADVMKQYEETFPHFEFMGPFPIDFAAPNPYSANKSRCLISEMCELRVANSLRQGKTAIGIIYNLDPHFKSGSHWVANYIDLKRKRCMYFDSYGMQPPPQVATFMKWLVGQDPAMQLSYNARRLQFKNTECGVFSLYFIIRMLAGDEFVSFSRAKPGDSDMLNLRKWLFST